MGHQNLRKKIVDTGQKMYEDGLVQGTWGNVSCRIPDEPFMIITPSGMDYLRMEPEDLVVVDWEGNLVEGRWRPSTECRLHGEIYRARSDISAIVHCHSPHATAFAAAHLSIPAITEEIAQVAGGPVAVAPYTPCGSSELADAAVKALGRQNAVLLANHGVVGTGKDLAEALRTCVIVERTAHIAILAQSIGGYVELSPEQVEYLRNGFVNDYGQRGKL